MTRWKQEAAYEIARLHSHNRMSNAMYETLEVLRLADIPVGMRMESNHWDCSTDVVYYIPSALKDHAETIHRNWVNLHGGLGLSSL